MKTNVGVVLLTLRLSGRVVNLQVKGLSVGPLDHCDVASRPLVGLGQRVCPPVSPVDLSTVHGDSKRVWQILMPLQDLDQTRTIVLGRVNGIRPAWISFWIVQNTLEPVCSCLHSCLFFIWPGINPEYATLQIIHRKSIWPASISSFLMDRLPAFPTHGCSFNPGQAGVPVGPEKDPEAT